MAVTAAGTRPCAPAITSRLDGRAGGRLQSSETSSLEFSSIVVLNVLFVAMAVFFLRSPGTSDVDLMLKWTTILQEQGLVDGYAGLGFYPPLASVFLVLVAKLAAWLQWSPLLGFKIGVFVLWALTLGIAGLFRSKTLLILVNGVTALSALPLGYLDILFGAPLLLSFYFLRRARPGGTGLAVPIASALFTLSVFCKWQPLMLAPFFFAYASMLSFERGTARVWAKRLLMHVVLPATFVMIPIFAVFGRSVIDAFVLGTEQAAISGYALNLGWIGTYLLHLWFPARFGAVAAEGFFEIIWWSPHLIRWLTILIFSTTYGATLLAYVLSPRQLVDCFVYGAVGFLAYVTLAPAVHENHLFAGVLTLATAAALYPSRRLLWTAALWILLANLNLVTFYGLDGQGLGALSFESVGVPTTVLLSAVEVVAFGVLFYHLVCVPLWARAGGELDTRQGARLVPTASPKS